MSTVTYYLSVDDLIQVGRGIVDDLRIRDLGALQSAAARPQTVVFGQDAYPTFPQKAASLLHSIARNDSLVDGNKRLAWAGTRVFCLLNDYDIRLTVDAAENLVVSAAKGSLDVTQIAEVLSAALVQTNTWHGALENRG